MEKSFPTFLYGEINNNPSHPNTIGNSGPLSSPSANPNKGFRAPPPSSSSYDDILNCQASSIEIADFARGGSTPWDSLIESVSNPICLIPHTRKQIVERVLRENIPFSSTPPWDLASSVDRLKKSNLNLQTEEDILWQKKTKEALSLAPPSTIELLPLLGQLSIISPKGARDMIAYYFLLLGSNLSQDISKASPFEINDKLLVLADNWSRLKPLNYLIEESIFEEIFTSYLSSNASKIKMFLDLMVEGSLEEPMYCSLLSSFFHWLSIHTHDISQEKKKELSLLVIGIFQKIINKAHSIDEAQTTIKALTSSSPTLENFKTRRCSQNLFLEGNRLLGVLSNHKLSLLLFSSHHTERASTILDIISEFPMMEELSHYYVDTSLSLWKKDLPSLPPTLLTKLLKASSHSPYFFYCFIDALLSETENYILPDNALSLGLEKEIANYLILNSPTTLPRMYLYYIIMNHLLTPSSHNYQIYIDKLSLETMKLLLESWHGTSIKDNEDGQKGDNKQAIDIETTIKTAYSVLENFYLLETFLEPLMAWQTEIDTEVKTNPINNQ